MARLLCLLVLTCPALLLAAPPMVQEQSAEQIRNDFTTQRAIVTGLVEGVTEYLPVSSTGHMIVSDAILGVNKDPKILTEKNVVNRKGNQLSLEKIADDYIVIIQLGAIAAVLLIFFQRIKSIITGVWRRDQSSISLAIAILIAFVPAAGLGYALKEYIPFYVEWVAVALIIGGLVIFWAESKLPKPESEKDSPLNVTPRQAWVIGLCQCLALIPGTSRSLATILGGRWAGLTAAAATEFSFLVGFIILTVASLYKMYSLGPALLQVYPLGNASLGLLVAAISAFISVKWMIGFISKRGLRPFAWYRIGAGVAILGAKTLGYF